MAIIGRPNVGKSTLFNSLIGSSRAIVGDEPGITRDRLYHDAEYEGKRFVVVDTGGMLPHEQEQIPREIVKQASLAIAEADAILFVVEAQTGLHSMDEEICRKILQSGKRFLTVVNKVDSTRMENEALQFYRLGVPEVYPVSAEHKRGLDRLLEDLTADFPRSDAEAAPAETRIAIIGRPNVGKSSLVNALVGAERVIVSEVPGTTRDAVDTALEVNGHRYRLIDTAGIRKKGKTHLAAEKISVIMARRHLAAADLAILLLDPLEGVTHMDATIAGYALESGKAIILGVNKLDLLPGGSAGVSALRQDIRDKLPFLDYAPMLFFVAKTGRRVTDLFPVFRKAEEHRRMRITTPELNQFYHQMLKQRSIDALPASGAGVKYMLQVRVAPPTFLMFVQRGKKLPESERRFVINQIRRRFEFFANPIQLIERR